MTLTEIFSIIIIHWIADFVMQDEKWALGKSKNLDDLLNHTSTYSFIWFFAISILLTSQAKSVLDAIAVLPLSFIFMIITFVAHTLTDYFTSKIVSKRFEKEVIFNLKTSPNIFEEGDVIQHGSNKFIIMKHLANDSKVKLYNSIPNLGAFTIIGFDQVLHYIQLFSTYYLITNI